MNQQAVISEIGMALTVTAEVMQQQFSPQALLVMAEDLALYGVDAVKTALTRVRRECNRLSLQAVIERIDDGRPGVEEAWAMLPRDESQTVVWTDEMAEAYGVCSPLLAEGDTVAARMAFKEKYTALLSKSRAEARSAHWVASLGTDKTGREEALKLAVEAGKLTADYARKLLPDSSYRITTGGKKLLGGISQAVALLESGDMPNYAKNGEAAARILDEILGRKSAYKPKKIPRLIAVGTLSECGTARFIGGDPIDPKAWEIVCGSEAASATIARGGV